MLRTEMEQLLARAQVSVGFRRELVSGLETSGGCFHPGNDWPKSWPVFLFAKGLCRRYDHVAPAALAIELCLAAADMLDDVEDEEGSGGLPQAQTLNRATACLLLNPICLDKLRESNEVSKARRAAEAVQMAALRSCQGQALDLAFEGRKAVTEAEYLQMIEWKASSLFSAACAVGALLSTDDASIIEASAEYGKCLGMARQMVNDAGAIASGENKSDVRRRKRTLPVIYALDQARGSHGQLLQDLYAASAAPAAEEEAAVREAIIQAGGVHYAMVLADVYRQRANACIPATGVSRDVAETLALLTNL